MSEHSDVPKRRLGVVLLVPEPVAREIDGLRRALGDGALGRVPPHITLVPPVNVRDDRFADALRVVRTAAARAAPLSLTLGPPATFMPANPVVYLEVGGDVDALVTVRDAVFVPPLERPLTWPFVPHVTLAEDLDPADVDDARRVLGHYAAGVVVERVHVLEERPGRVWEAVADYPFRPAAVVGRGGLPVELTVSDRPDPEPVAASTFVVTARRDGRVVGSASVAIDADGEVAALTGLHVAEDVRGEGIGRHLEAAARSEAARRGAVLPPLLS